MIAVVYSNANHDDAVAIDEDDKSNFMLTMSVLQKFLPKNVL